MSTPLINALNNAFVQSVRQYSKEELWTAIGHKPYAFFSTYTFGRVQSYVNEVSFAARSIEQTSMLTIIQLLAMLVLYTVMLIKQDYRLGLLYLVIFSGYLFVSRYMARKNRTHVAVSLRKTSVVSEYMQDFYENIDTVMSVRSRDFEQKRVSAALQDERRIYYSVQNTTNMSLLVQQTLVILFAGVVSFFGFAIVGTSDNRTMGILLILLYSVLNLSGFGQQYLGFEELLNRMRSGLGFLRDDSGLAGTLPQVVLDSGIEALTVSHVVFSQHTGQKIFADFSATFPKGQLTALVGHNGTGKSTLLKIIDHFYPVEAGTITLPYSHPKILYLPQSATLFDRSVYANIVYPESNVGVATVWQLVKEIGLTTLVPSAADLTKNISGELTRSTSGGEQQKILFLRAIIYHPNVLLMDELTSNLDEETVDKIYMMINKYLAGVTVIGVVHRKSELKYYHHVVSLT